LPKEVRLGFVGAGGIAGFHLQNLKEVPEAKVVAFADPNLDAAKKRAQEVGLPVREGETVFADWQTMLERVEMEGVLILSPHAHHFEQILAALKRGLAVLCEKPMVITSEQARKVIAAAKEAGKPVVVSYQRRFQSAFRFIREQVRKGVLGEITFVEATIAQDWQQLTRWHLATSARTEWRRDADGFGQPHGGLRFVGDAVPADEGDGSDEPLRDACGHQRGSQPSV
jgi:predicted dehydrogenase